MTTTPPEPEPIGGMPTDPKRSEQVFAIAQRILHTEGVQIGWMDGDIARRLLETFKAGHTMVFMQLVRQGLTREQAESNAEIQMPLIAFELGLRIGAELESTRAFREIMGDVDFDFGEGPAPSGD